MAKRDANFGVAVLGAAKAGASFRSVIGNVADLTLDIVL